MDVFAVLIVWVLLCFGVAALASSRGRSGVGFFLLSFFISPLVGLIIVLVVKDLKVEAAQDLDRQRDEERRDRAQKREHERQLESLRVLAASKEGQPSTTASSAARIGSYSLADELTKLAALRDSGVLSTEEFEQQKRLLLQRG